MKRCDGFGCGNTEANMGKICCVDCIYLHMCDDFCLNVGQLEECMDLIDDGVEYRVH